MSLLRVLELPLLSSRLVLRELKVADASTIARLANDGRISRNLGSEFPYPYSIADAHAFLARPAETLAIELAERPEEGLIGTIGSKGVGNRWGVVRFGYWLGAQHWGQGLATEAVRTYVAALATVPEVRRVEASVYEWNPASSRVLEKAGFSLEGRRIARGWVRGEIGDELEYGLVF